MASDTGSALQREGLRFFGSIAAGLSHELSNVFTIINELAGLEQDIARAAEDGGVASPARIADLAARIRVQVERGEALNRRLHGFAHSIDGADVAFDLGELLGLLEALAARAARLARVELEVHPPDPPVTLQGDPFALLLAVHACVAIGLRSAADSRRLLVRGETAGGGARVVVESADPLSEAPADLAAEPALELGRSAWGASVVRDGTDRLVLTLPATAAGTPPEDSHAT